jgi:hypothetical protein
MAILFGTYDSLPVAPNLLDKLQHMSLDYYFYIETRISGDFTVPEGFPRGRFESEPRGEFTWLRGRSPVAAGLFFGSAAVFPFHRGVPEHTSRSALLRSLGPHYDFEHDERRISWIAFPDLMVDLWDEMQLILQCNVPSRDAALFADGRRAFPAEALKQQGISEYDIGRLREGNITSSSIDRTQGRDRFQIESAAPESRIAVTFVETVRDYLGHHRVEAFRGLRMYGADDELRVISMFC